MSLRVSVSVHFCSCVQWLILGVDWGVMLINGKKERIAPSGAWHKNVPVSTTPNHWRQALLKDTD